MEKIKRGILAIAIAIIFVMFVGYAIETFYNSPDYDDYCEEKLREQSIITQEACEAVGGKWTQYNEVGEQRKPVPEPINEAGEIKIKPEGWCNPDFTCMEEYDGARELYNRNVFFISGIIGLVAIVLALVFAAEVVSTGFLGGGVLLIIYGTIRYWGEMSDVYRTILLAITLGILIWIGYKKLK